jgi:hypothetical protein
MTSGSEFASQLREMLPAAKAPVATKKKAAKARSLLVKEFITINPFSMEIIAMPMPQPG